jgi:solute carrier family 38 (sodium-coupled neutral amino acid transporter), member 11
MSSLSNDDHPVEGNRTTRVTHPNNRPLRSQVSSIDAPVVKTGVAGASSNLVNAIVGAGIIGIPFAIKESGLVVGVLLLVVVGVFTEKSLRLIVDLASFHPKLRNLGVLTYEDLMEIPFGRRGKKFVLISMLILAYGAMVAYLLVVKDCLPDIFSLGDSFIEREVIMFVTSLLIMLPLSLLRDISQLAFTSFLSVAADVVLVAIACLFAPVETSVSAAGGLGAVIASNWIDSGLFIGLGVLSTAMACQHSSFLISNTFRNHTSSRWARVTVISLSIATSLSLTLGVVGYLGFLDDTQGDVLTNFGTDNVYVHSARALLAITMFLTYPMESFVARHVVAQLLFSGSMDNTTVDSSGNTVPESKWLGCIGRRERWTIYLYVAALIPALAFKDLGPVLSLTGSLGASCVAYIAPGLVYLGVNGDDFIAWITGRQESDGNAEIELPVAGDAKASIGASFEGKVASKRKPWWWYPCGAPIWVAIARTGDNGCKHFLSDMTTRVGQQIAGDGDNEVDNIGPRRSDYVNSIILLIFGVVALVAGVVSNVYVQVNNVFYTPS